MAGPAEVTTDVVVLGGGPAGEVAAGRVADRGLDTVLVERELVGGECSYWGCIPSKTLVRPGDVLAAAPPGPRAGARGPPPRPRSGLGGRGPARRRRRPGAAGLHDLVLGRRRARALADRARDRVDPRRRPARWGAAGRGRRRPGDPRPAGGPAGHRQRCGAAPGAGAGRRPALGQPVRDRGEGGTRPTARPRRGCRGRGTGAGLIPARLVRGHRRRGLASAAPARGAVRR